MSPKIILFAIPFFFLLIGIEMLWGYLKKRKLYRLNDGITNLNIGIGQQTINLLFKGLVLTAFVFVQKRFGFLEIPLTWWSFLIAFVLFDFLFYWAHRWSHEINLWWGAHVVHHSSEEYNLSVALRQSWFHNTMAFFIFLPLPLIGFKAETLVLAGGLHALGQFWIHTRTIGKLHPWIEFIFNTPSHHRVHHGRNPKYIDKNHGGVLIIFDRIFGTFQVEEEEPVYGITSSLDSWNPIWANFHYYAEMGKAMKKMKFVDKIRMIFAKPGWLPDYMGGFQAPPEVDPKERIRYDKNTSPLLRAYTLVNFVLISMGMSTLMYFFDELSLFYRVAFFATMLLSLLIVGAIFENKTWVLVAEYARLFLIFVLLNALYYQSHLDWFRIMLFASSAGIIILSVLFTFGWRSAGFRLVPVAKNE